MGELGNGEKQLTKARVLKDTLAGVTVMRLAREHGYANQAQIREAIRNVCGIEINHQKFSQWCNGDTSFPNNFAEVFTRTMNLDHEEMIELSIALSFGQKRTRLLKPTSA